MVGEDVIDNQKELRGGGNSMLCQRCTFCEDYEVRYISRLYTLFLLF